MTQPPQPASDHGLLTVNVSTLLTEPIGSQRHYALADAPFRFNGESVRVCGATLFTRTDGSILADADLDLTITETCGMCLTPYALPVAVSFVEEFWPDYDPISRTRAGIPEGREGFPIVEGHLGLQEALRQYIEMARPMRPNPIMPSVRPRMGWWSSMGHCPARVALSSCGIDLATANSRAMVCSATASRFAVGVTVTATPLSVAAATSTLSRPTPIRATTRNSGSATRTAAV